MFLFGSPKRVQLSFLVAKTQKLLFGVLMTLAFLLASAYLFLMNKVSMEGYVLSKEAEHNTELSSELEQLESQIAQRETQEYVAKMSDANAMLVRGRQNFVVLRPIFTAQK